MDELSDKDYVIIDEFLPQSLYTEVRSFFDQTLPQFTPAGIGSLDQNMVIREVRGDNTFWLDRKRDTELNAFWALVDETIQVYNRYCYLSLSGYEFHLANYPPGGHYDKHLDQFQNRNNRMISFIIYLNENWQQGDGGELEIFRPGGSSFLVPPISNRCVMFKSATVPHAVRESYKNRYSLTGWLLYVPAAVGKFLG